MTNAIHIDGRAGEGGGQILRTSLALAALTGRPLRMDHIRAGRRKPGLLRQHLTALRAAATLTGAQVEGAELGSGAIRFRPGPVRGGEHTFAIGSAGSALLVFQTVLPILLRAPEASVIHFTGGTHNPWAPTFDFVAEVFAPMLRRMGVDLELTLERHGFYPAGGGAFTLRMQPATLTPLTGAEEQDLQGMDAEILVANLPFRIVQRESAVLRARLGLDDRDIHPRKVASAGPGNVVSVRFRGAVPERVTSFARKGVAAEKVAEDCARQAQRYRAHGAPVGEHLADQLLLPVALGGGRFTTGPLSSHGRTNVETIRAFLGSDALQVAVDGERTVVSRPD